MEQTNFRSGFVSLLGKPNVGKSTLLNQLIGQEISITANKPQTTRNQIRGIVTKDNYQAILLDTPGIHLPKNELHRRIVNYALTSIKEVDLIFFIVNPHKREDEILSEDDQLVLEKLASAQNKVILLINKIDMFPNQLVLRTIEKFHKEFNFLEVLPVSAKTGLGIEKLNQIFEKHLPKGIAYFPADQITDAPERTIIGELVREQITRLCFQEVPYGAAVAVDRFVEKDGRVEIHVTIHVERESHKKIIIGKGGSMLKRVGMQSRQKMEHMLGVKVYLRSHVKVSRNWFNNPRLLNEFGYSE
ncbi:MAG: GTPase Era [SAR324 cluster bacterium]|uniref:GTPase Era n=1 Tax=SAR324 cluster bacterium TaxID=2024889 RepID=A0A2A4T7A7_9DELT|nr:MAG: GTPase Era [SAR324 cluster bacterium]